jgi:DNA repair protein RadC
MRIPIYRVELVREASVVTPSRLIQSPADACDILRAFIGASDREHFAILLLDTRNRAIGINTVSVGHLNASVVHPREVFKPAILSSAAGLILGHNHPSGDPDPSQEDIALTHRLKQAGELLGIPVLDHIVLGDPGFASLNAGVWIVPVNLCGYRADVLLIMESDWIPDDIRRTLNAAHREGDDPDA